MSETKLMNREEIEKSLKNHGHKLTDFLDFCAKNQAVAYVINPDTEKEEKFLVTGYYENGDIKGYFLNDLMH